MYSLILTTEFDKTTDIVIDWLRFFKTKVIRINKEDCINRINFKLTDSGNFLKIETEHEYYEISSNVINQL